MAPKKEVTKDTKTQLFNAGAPPPEILVPRIVVRGSDRLDWRYWVAGTPGRVTLNLMDHGGHIARLVDQSPPLPKPISRLVFPPTAGAGDFMLYWGMITAGVDWQVCTEILINDIFVFRHYKSGDSKEPFTRGFMPVRVL